MCMTMRHTHSALPYNLKRHGTELTKVLRQDHDDRIRSMDGHAG